MRTEGVTVISHAAREVILDIVYERKQGRENNALDDVGVVRDPCVLDLLNDVLHEIIYALQRPQPLTIHMIDLITV